MGYKYRVIIDGVEYGQSDISSGKIESPLFDKMSIGNACAAELDIVFWPKAVISKMAKIIPYVIREDGTETQLGVFWTDTREKQGDRLNIIAYDSMLKADIVWEYDQSWSFPMKQDEAVRKIAAQLDVEIDPRTSVSSVFEIDTPVDEPTIREVLCWIAAANGGNWIFTNEGKLLLVPLFDGMPAESSYLITEDGDPITVGGVRIIV